MPEPNQVKNVGVRRGYDEEVLYASEDPSSTATVNQASVTTTATLIKAALSTRKSITIVNHSSSDVYLGTSVGVTTANGVLLTAGGSVTLLRYTGAIYGITASGTATVSYWEM